MVEATQLWVAALGAVCAALAFIVFYAVRKVLILKEDVDKAKERLTVMETYQKETAELLRSTIAPEVSKLKEDQKEMISKLSADIRDLNASQLVIHTKVNEQDLRVKTVSSLVNQLSVQQQDSMQSGGFMQNSANQRMDKGDNKMVNSNGSATSPKSAVRSSSPSQFSGKSPKHNNSVTIYPQSPHSTNVNLMSEGASEMSAYLSSLLFANNQIPLSSGNNNLLSADQSNQSTSAITMLARAANIGNQSNANINSTIRSTRRDGIPPNPPSTSTLVAILRSKNIPVATGFSTSPATTTITSNSLTSNYFENTLPPSSVSVYHQTHNPQRISNTPLYRKKLMYLQFSVGPQMNETAIGLALTTSHMHLQSSTRASGAPLHRSAVSKRRAPLDGSGTTYRGATTNINSLDSSVLDIPLLSYSLQGDLDNDASSSSSADPNAVLLYMKDIILLSMSYEPLPIDESDSICFTFTIKPTERSLHNLHIDNNGGSRLLKITGVSSSSQPVEVVLYAPMCPTVEEWVAFLYTNLGDKVRLKDDLL